MNNQYKPNTTRQELTDRIYDTIMESVGMSEHHIKFMDDKVSDPLCYAKSGRIEFEYDGAEFVLTLDYNDQPLDNDVLDLEVQIVD